MKLTERQITVDTYNNSAKELAEYFSGIGARHNDIDKTLIYTKKNPRVLEIGCGDGKDADYILTKTSNYQGFDISEEMIKIAQSKNQKGKFFVADLEKFNYKKYGKFQAIFSFASLLHSNQTEVEKIIRDVADGLIKGGVFFISLKMKDSYQKEIKKDKFGIRIFYYYTLELITEFAKKNYKVLFVEKQKIGKTDWFSILLQKK
jgi:SAM-dependent methyltransferase